MKRSLILALLLIFLGFMWIVPLGMPIGSELAVIGNYDRTYTFDLEQGSYHATYTLYTSVPPSLYDYYRGKTNSINSDRDYSKFVTPEPVQTLANNLWKITLNKTSSNEEFANNVLALVHQFQYSVSNIKYPVEALAENSGDCDVLSVLAASILKAGGLDVVLLVYRDLYPAHMNIGIHLPYKPVYDETEIEPTGFKHNNKTYWVAECTPTGSWKVGDQPDSFASSRPVIIPIENCEECSPAYVSSNLNEPLIPSAVSVNLSLENTNSENIWAFMISGSILPEYSDKQVVVYVSHDGGYSYTILKTVTNNLGNYSIPCYVPASGTYTIRTSLIGFSNYACSDSETITVFVGLYPTGFIQNMTEYKPSDQQNATFAFKEITGHKISSRGNNAFLKSRLTGANISLSGEFIIINTGLNTTNGEQTITLPEMKQTIIRYGRRPLEIIIPERTIKVQESNLENNQFGFVLENDDGNYSASVKLLDSAEVSNIEHQLDGSNATFMNVSRSIERNIWYKALAKISGHEITTELRSENGTLLETTAIEGDAIDISKFGILLSCDPYTFVAFKNLKVESFDQLPASLVGSLRLPANGFETLAPYIMILVLLVMACSAIYFLKKTKNNSDLRKSRIMLSQGWHGLIRIQMETRLNGFGQKIYDLLTKYVFKWRWTNGCNIQRSRQ